MFYGRDVTERKRAEEETQRLNKQLENMLKEHTTHLEATIAKLEHNEQVLRKSEERYRLVAEGISDGIWEWDVRTGDVFWNDRLLEMLGLSRSEFTPTFEGVIELIHPEDRQEVMDAVAVRPKSSVPEHEVSFHKELRMRHSTGEYRNHITRGKVQRDKDGALLHVVGIMIDITEHKRKEEALRESEERFRTTFDLAAVGIAHVAPDGRWLIVNQKLCDIVGYTCEELLEKTFQEITHPDDLDADLEQVRRMLAGEIETYSMEKRYVKKDRSQVWVDLRVSLVRERSLEPSYFISIIEDITERRRKKLLLCSLTPREVEVLRLLAEGYTNREIAKSMNFSVGTAKINVGHIIAKLQVSDRTQAAVLAVEAGLTPRAVKVLTQ